MKQSKVSWYLSDNLAYRDIFIGYFISIKAVARFTVIIAEN